MRGRFLVVEGSDGAGKSVQIERLKKYLESRGEKVVVTKEPTTESAAGRKAREVLSKKETLDPFELQRLFAEDRREHLANKVLPALARGETVISDRYFFSSIAYGSLGCDIERIIDLNKDFRIPDATFFLLVSAETSMERIKARGDAKRELFEHPDKLRKVIQTYQELPSRFPNIHVIDAERTIEEVHEEVVSRLLVEV